MAIPLDRITRDPKIMNGQPCVRGMRLTVRRVLEALVTYPVREQFFAEYPELEEEDLRQVMALVAENSEEKVGKYMLPCQPRQPQAPDRRAEHALMWFLLDQGLPRSTVAALAELGESVEHAADLGMAAFTDEAIFHAAREQNAVLVTFDADFYLYVAATRSAPSVIHIRNWKCQDVMGNEVARDLKYVIDRHKEALERGVTVSLNRSRGTWSRSSSLGVAVYGHNC